MHAASTWLPSSGAVGLWGYVCVLLMQVCVSIYTADRLTAVATSLGLSRASDFAQGFGFKSRNTRWLTSISYLETKINRRE